jgi:hypothetical protein
VQLFGKNAFYCLNTTKRVNVYKVVQIWPGQTVTCLHTISPGHIWTTLYIIFSFFFSDVLITKGPQALPATGRRTSVYL